VWLRAPRNTWIIEHQDQTDDVFFVVSGTVRVQIQTISGRDMSFREIGAGEFFGELSAIDGKPRSSGVVALTDVTIARMRSAVFRATVHGHSDVCDQLLTVVAGQVRAMSNRVAEYTTLDVRSRLYAELLRMSRPQKGTAKTSVISPPPAHSQIAARIGTRRETVTRELTSLERAGLIVRRRGAIVLVDTEELGRLVDQERG
jgi:CRP-like cAMP-binding protein